MFSTHTPNPIVQPASRTLHCLILAVADFLSAGHFSRRSSSIPKTPVTHPFNNSLPGAVSLVASHLGDPGSISGRVTAESCRTMPLVGGFSRGSPVSPAISFRRCSILTSSTLIGSQDLDVERRLYLLTHSQTQRYIFKISLARRSDEALGVGVSVARIAPSLLDLGRADGAKPRFPYVRNIADVAVGRGVFSRYSRFPPPTHPDAVPSTPHSSLKISAIKDSHLTGLGDPTLLHRPDERKMATAGTTASHSPWLRHKRLVFRSRMISRRLTVRSAGTSGLCRIFVQATTSSERPQVSDHLVIGLPSPGLAGPTAGTMHANYLRRWFVPGNHLFNNQVVYSVLRYIPPVPPATENAYQPVFGRWLTVWKMYPDHMPCMFNRENLWRPGGPRKVVHVLQSLLGEDSCIGTSIILFNDSFGYAAERNGSKWRRRISPICCCSVTVPSTTTECHRGSTRVHQGWSRSTTMLRRHPVAILVVGDLDLELTSVTLTQGL
ncbi:hypothetical protein PR048_029181 [Dryococelus australis]|uniref:Uncharacterized protein n=1 Tax=Dryococelus australis TaxID=614101 RepID=A0ABQ9GCZ3_9NEOP|nr:hypothetical protein PR048_029181 [Dryococelus australis]